MDKLEHYLDQVCRGIGGPRSLRQHVRQELREHLRDAAAEHQAAGMSEAEALDRALEDFGGPEQVRHRARRSPRPPPDGGGDRQGHAMEGKRP